MQRQNNYMYFIFISVYNEDEERIAQPGDVFVPIQNDHSHASVGSINGQVL